MEAEPEPSAMIPKPQAHAISILQMLLKRQVRSGSSVPGRSWESDSMAVKGAGSEVSELVSLLGISLS